MQDQTQSSSDKKQYFDIKSPSNPDPTSRPVINNSPVQADPMVSATNLGDIEVISSSKPEYDFQPPSPTTTVSSAVDDSVKVDTPSPDKPVQIDPTATGNESITIPDLPGGADPAAVSYQVPISGSGNNTPQTIYPTTAPKTEDNVASPVSPELPPTPPNSINVATVATNEPAGSGEQSNSVVTQPNPVAETTISNPPAMPLTQVSQETPQIVTSSTPQSTKAHKGGMNLKIIAGFVILLILVVAAFLVHKYKIGK